MKRRCWHRWRAGISGAVCWDVFAKEPLDREHRFWSHPRVFVTPHVSAVTHVALMVENVGRFLKGDNLRNVVNLKAGY